MTEFLLQLIDDWGIWGIFLSLFIEGSAFPFFGTLFIVTVGFFLESTWFEILIISFIGSLFYAVGSYIPYVIGKKLGNAVEYRLNGSQRIKFEKVKKVLNKHGVWSIALLSPLHVGNVIPFLAGMSYIKLPLYTGLTMLGIAPSTFLFLSIGQFYEGELNTLVNRINEYQTIILFVLGIIILIYVVLKVYKYRNQK